jgi:hypothetical protein
VTESDEFDRWADYLDPAEADPELPAEQREQLDRLAEALSSEATWSQPPAGLRTALLAAAREAAATEVAATEVAAAEVGAAEAATTEAAGRDAAPRTSSAEPSSVAPAPSPEPAAVAPTPPPKPAMPPRRAEATTLDAVIAGSTGSIGSGGQTGSGTQSGSGNQTGSGGPTADDARGGSVTPLARRSRRRTWWVSVAGLAAAAVVAVAVFTAWPRPQTQVAGERFPMSGTALAPQATASALIEPKSAGVAITLQIKGLAPAPPGAYYAAWLKGTTGIVPVGTFHWHKGGIPINLWSGVTADRYPELFVTLQREGQPPAPSAQVVLSGKVSG